MDEKRNNYCFITWLRATSVLLILMCHYVQQSSSTLLNMAAQFFNIGVNIFFLISGFLFGSQKHLGSCKQWYFKRFKRIFIPYEFFVLILGAVTLLMGGTIMKIDWLLLVSGLQGTAVGVLGAEQTWFITVLLLCYALTPPILKLIDVLIRKRIIWVLAVAVILLPAVWIIIPIEFLSTIVGCLDIYILALVIGRCFKEIKKEKRLAIISIVIICISFSVRITGRYFFDGTALYNHGIVTYTQLFASLCIFYVFAVFFQKIRPLPIVNLISEISYEIYLLHYMFCVGPIRLFSLTPSWILNCIIVTTLTLLLSLVLHRVVKIIMLKGGKESL